MAIQLTPEQERRIQAIVESGAYPNTEEALDAAVSAVEFNAATEFDGTTQELAGLLTEGLASGEISEETFWESIDKETSALLRAHKRSPRS